MIYSKVHQLNESRRVTRVILGSPIVVEDEDYNFYLWSKGSVPEQRGKLE